LLLLTTAALPQLEQHDHPNLGRLITPRHFPRLADTLSAGYPTAADNDCFQGLDAARVCAMLEAIAPWPSVGARVRRAWPGSGRALATLAHGAGRAATLFENEALPRLHPNLLWVAVPDVVGDADASLELFRAWHMLLCHVPLAFVLQDGAERPGRIPWEAPGLAAVFLGGTTRWRFGLKAADLVRQARARGLLVHAGRISTARQIRYVQSIGATSFDSSRYSRWRELLLDDGLARASQPPQLRLVP
jgi:hypothetical protein